MVLVNAEKDIDEECNVFNSPLGLDDITFTAHDEDMDSFTADGDYVCEPFDDIYNEYEDYVCDPFDNIEDSATEIHGDEFEMSYDPYFHVYVGASTPTGNQKVTPSNVMPTDVLPTPSYAGKVDHEEPIVDKFPATDPLSSNVHAFKELKCGEILPSKLDIELRLRVMNIKANREIRITHSDHSRIIAVCVDKGCKWRIRGSFLKSSGCWIIKRFINEHTCSMDARFPSARGTASSKAIAHMIKGDHNRPGFIKADLEEEYGIKISYYKAWRAKEMALQLVRGKPEDSFKGIAAYFWLLEQANPGTYSAYDLDVNNCFVQSFLAFGQCLAGFRSCIRPVIAVDASHLKGRYRGKLFIATCMDGNQQIYPLAFGVAPTENDESWSWFFKQLRHVVGAGENLVFISDRHVSIEKCCKEIFPDAIYGICMFHLGLNMQQHFKVKAEEFLYGVAKAYTVLQFEEKIHYLRSTKREVYDYLIDADPTKWARCYFPSRRYSIMTTNIAESMNAVLKDAREFPIIGMLETIRLLLQKWFYDRYTLAGKWSNELTPYAERKVAKRDDKSRRFRAHAVNANIFYMLDSHRDATVDIMSQTCTCNKFQLNQLPCPHAIRACRERNVSVYSMCSRYYTTECWRLAYALPIMPVPHRTEWSRIVPPEIQSVVIYPPVMKNKVGRPRKKRIPSQGEVKRVTRCGRCKGTGHNRQTCKQAEYVPIHQHDKVG